MASDVEGASIVKHFKRPRYVDLAAGIGWRKDLAFQRKRRHQQKIHTLQRLIVGGPQRPCQVLGLGVVATLIIVLHVLAKQDYELDGLRKIVRTYAPAPAIEVQGIERNVVLTLWDWGRPTGYLHDEVSTDRR